MRNLVGRRDRSARRWAWHWTDREDTGIRARSTRAFQRFRGSLPSFVGLAAVMVAAAFVVVSLSVVGGASASNVHLKGGKNAEPSFTDNGLTLSASGALVGLGNGDVLITIDATANPTANCTNPGGQSKVPGQNPAPVDVTGSVSIPDAEIKNGNTPFSVTTLAPATPIPGAPDCPNRSWTETITDMAFTSATITVKQGGATVLTISCTFSSPTSDNGVPKANVSCL